MSVIEVLCLLSKFCAFCRVFVFVIDVFVSVIGVLYLLSKFCACNRRFCVCYQRFCVRYRSFVSVIEVLCL